MKKTNKKGFTIVELVVVIAVIAILAAALIPTFTTIINKANESAAMQKAAAAYKEAYAIALINDGLITAGETVENVNGFTFEFEANGANAEVTVPSGFGYTVEVAGGVVTATKA